MSRTGAGVAVALDSATAAGGAPVTVLCATPTADVVVTVTPSLTPGRTLTASTDLTVAAVGVAAAATAAAAAGIRVARTAVAAVVPTAAASATAGAVAATVASPTATAAVATTAAVTAPAATTVAAATAAAVAATPAAAAVRAAEGRILRHDADVGSREDHLGDGSLVDRAVVVVRHDALAQGQCQPGHPDQPQQDAAGVPGRVDPSRPIGDGRDGRVPVERRDGRSGSGQRNPGAGGWARRGGKRRRIGPRLRTHRYIHSHLACASALDSAGRFRGVMERLGVAPQQSLRSRRVARSGRDEPS